MTKHFRPGISVLLEHHVNWIAAGLRVGLVAHPASIDETGIHSSQRLWDHPDINLCALYGPEHGFEQRAPAGETISSGVHNAWHIPIHSLYGSTRKPTAEMLTDVDVIIMDLQDLAVRCYTYISTLKYVLEASAESGKLVIVADRPVPFPETIDGPLLEAQHESFVTSIPTPMVYGMTPGETALFLKKQLTIDVRLKVAQMDHYERTPQWPKKMPWISPSPGIKTWQTAAAYPATVFCEAFPQFDYGKGTDLVFQIIAIPGLKGNEVCDALSARGLPGVEFAPHTYPITTGRNKGHTVTGVQLIVKNPVSFRPSLTMLCMLNELQNTCGIDAVWGAENVRETFFDQLMGTDMVRLALQQGEKPEIIAERWNKDLARFNERRRENLLYGQRPSTTKIEHPTPNI